ncbi:cbb3-type cytochrome c oxidase subunit II [Fulvivirgaceae bacterium BMA12]|uniref:Cbb3-type cytochrome c oxidase subunit II n=1 Tax=Agaribacillus aureus TaxID=3051825 RepID=A0ABT8LIG0_9BACT|nr:cbb3-type cytochrome c oxidase subunit II [Fulvivirgaceae bacterium BMA12]
MNLSFHTNHRLLVSLIFGGFGLLSLGIAVLPAYNVQENNRLLPRQSPLTAAEQRGKDVYIAEGCVGCHTQQVRTIAMDKTWGERPGIPADYATNTRPDLWRQTASILGTERTGPDLTNIGQRQPSIDWHLLHLFNPRMVVAESIMPAYPWLFEEKENPGKHDRVVKLPPEQQKHITGQLVTTRKAEDLVAYLRSLKQPDLPVGIKINFIDFPKSKDKGRELQTVEGKVGDSKAAGGDKDFDGAALIAKGEVLFQARCAACHQGNGEGLAGAFPPLKGSEIVNSEDPSKMIDIILNGYDENEAYGAMPGFAGQLSDEEIASIASYERNSWGNSAPVVEPATVKAIREMIKPPL